MKRISQVLLMRAEDVHLRRHLNSHASPQFRMGSKACLYTAHVYMRPCRKPSCVIWLLRVNKWAKISRFGIESSKDPQLSSKAPMTYFRAEIVNYSSKLPVGPRKKCTLHIPSLVVTCFTASCCRLHVSFIRSTCISLAHRVPSMCFIRDNFPFFYFAARARVTAAEERHESLSEFQKTSSDTSSDFATTPSSASQDSSHVAQASHVSIDDITSKLAQLQQRKASTTRIRAMS
jgi:hypothetical protein